MIEKNPPGSLQHFNPAALTHFQGFVACKPLECTSYPEAKTRRRLPEHNQAGCRQFPSFPPAEKDQEGK